MFNLISLFCICFGLFYNSANNLYNECVLEEKPIQEEVQKAPLFSTNYWAGTSWSFPTHLPSQPNSTFVCDYEFYSNGQHFKRIGYEANMYNRFNVLYYYYYDSNSYVEAYRYDMSLGADTWSNDSYKIVYLVNGNATTDLTSFFNNNAAQVTLPYSYTSTLTYTITLKNVYDLSELYYQVPSDAHDFSTYMQNYDTDFAYITLDNEEYVYYYPLPIMSNGVPCGTLYTDNAMTSKVELITPLDDDYTFYYYYRPYNTISIYVSHGNTDIQKFNIPYQYVTFADYIAGEHDESIFTTDYQGHVIMDFLTDDAYLCKLINSQHVPIDVSDTIENNQLYIIDNVKVLKLSEYENLENDSFDAGYMKAVDDNLMLNNIFGSIVQVSMIPVNFFLSIFNFEIFGINITGVVTGILTIALVTIVLRVVFVRKE